MDMLTWLADALRAAGLAVVEEPGWQERGLGSMAKARGVMLHHTAGPLKGNSPSLALVRDGRPDLRGPLSHLFLARDGTFHVLAAGRCNHAGTGSWQGITAGNSSFIGIEAENAGTGKDPWPQPQMVAYERGVAALLNHLGEDAVMACGHKEYALPRGRKIDPAFDMVTFRENVETIMANRETLDRMDAAAPVDPTRDMLRKGSQGTSVSALQRALGILADGAFGPKTVAAVKAYQTLHGLTADGIVGPKTWKALGF